MRRSGPMPDLAFTVPAVPDSIPVARHELDPLAGEVDPDLLDVLRLLLSEVVTNSIRHGRGTQTVEVRLWFDRGAIRIEVEDHGPGFRPPRRAPATDGGWGLVLVDKLADRWGVRSDSETTVWLELDSFARTARGRRDPAPA